MKGDIINTYTGIIIILSKQGHMVNPFTQLACILKTEEVGNKMPGRHGGSSL
jgi:hypothetical protein